MSKSFSEQDPFPKEVYQHNGDYDPKGKSHSGSSIGNYFLPTVLIASSLSRLKV